MVGVEYRARLGVSNVAAGDEVWWSWEGELPDGMELDASGVLPGAVVAEPGGRPLAVADRVIAIGPEGGWSPAELALAGDRVGFGATVLRVETAAVAAAVRALVLTERARP